MTLRTALRTIAILVVAVVVPACDKFAGYFNPFPGSTNAADLRGSQVVPAVVTAATGTATLNIIGGGSSIDFTVSQTGLGTVTAVRLHVGSAGTNGPAIFTLTSAPFVNPLIGTLTPASLTPAPAQGVSTFGDALAKLTAGDAYLIITTAANPLGEIRGQLGAATLASAKMSGAQVVPPFAGTGSGSATLQLNSTQTEIVATLTFTGLTGATTGASIHPGPAGSANATTTFILSAGAFTSPLTVTLDAADFTAGGGLATFADSVNALLSGRLYVVVEVAAVEEIRGQIGPAHLTAPMTGAAVVPASGSPNTGTATVVLNGTQTAVNVHIDHTISAPTKTLIHAAAAGVNGPQIFDVDSVAGNSISPIDASLTSAHLFPQAVQSIFVFPDAVDALIVGRTYVDVATSTLPQGAIRGQIVPVP